MKFMGDETCVNKPGIERDQISCACTSDIDTYLVKHVVFSHQLNVQPLPGPTLGDAVSDRYWVMRSVAGIG